MNLYEKIINKKEKIAVIGLGYVGMPLALALAKKVDVIGFDLNKVKIDEYKSGIDATNEVEKSELKSTKVHFTYEEIALREAKFYIVAVPTPINNDKTPDLTPIEKASEIIGRNLTRDSIIVYESTVYPGVTEDICLPILEKESGLKAGIDFKVGYSPERINPSDKVHKLENIKKIVSGMDEYSLDIIAKIYELIVEVGVYKVSCIKVAEAAKIVENSQRDINIAFMNELAIILNKMEIDSQEVIEAMNTKWNALGFYPGLVGGHCIGVDPYYFVYQAEKLGYHSQIILAGRKINDDMGQFIADVIIKKLVLAEKVVKKAKVAILGITFKENCSDIRNSRVEDIIQHLRSYGINPIIADPIANKKYVYDKYKIEMQDIENITNVDCIVLAVGHEIFKELDIDRIFGKCQNNKKILIDVKSILNKQDMEKRGYSYWRL